MPISVKDVQYSQINDIEFVGRRWGEHTYISNTIYQPVPKWRQCRLPTPAFESATEDDIEKIFQY